ncbi:MAG: hypothetical protein V4603_01835 [Pseudomonadota bacterium]
MHSLFQRIPVQATRAAVLVTCLLMVPAMYVSAQVAMPESLVANSGVDVFIEHLKTSAAPRWALTFVAMCTAAFLLALTGLGNVPDKVVTPAREGPQLPEMLRNVAVLGKRYTLEIFTGKVKAQTAAHETDVEPAETVGGSDLRAGELQLPWARSDAAAVAIPVAKSLVTLGYPDGSSDRWEFSSGQLNVALDDLISFIGCRNKRGRLECLFVYHHDNAQCDSFNLRAVHGIARLPTWFVATLVGWPGVVWGWQTAAAAFINEVEPGGAVAPISPAIWLAGFCVAALVALLPYLLAEILVPAIRTMLFRKRYTVWLDEFLQSSTLDAKRMFPIEWIPQPRTATSHLFYKPM